MKAIIIIALAILSLLAFAEYIAFLDALPGILKLIVLLGTIAGIIWLVSKNSSAIKTMQELFNDSSSEPSRANGNHTLNNSAGTYRHSDGSIRCADRTCDKVTYHDMTSDQDAANKMNQKNPSWKQKVYNGKKCRNWHLYTS